MEKSMPAYRALQYFLDRDQLGHALLISGPRGIGKKNMALSIMQQLNCQQQKTPPCGTCLACRKIIRGSHPDLYCLEPAGASIKISQIRDIKEHLHYRPQEGRVKGCIIEDADRLTPEAFNSLLKMLEDPPPGLIFILLTTRPSILSETVLSRCRHFSLEVPSPHIPADSGSVPFRDVMSLSLLKFLNIDGTGRDRGVIVDDEWIQKREEAFKFVTYLREGEQLTVLNQTEALSERPDLTDFLDLLLSIYRDRFIWRCTREPDLMINTDYLNFFRYKPLVSLRHLTEGIEQIMKFRNNLLFNINIRLNLEVMFLWLKGVF